MRIAVNQDVVKKEFQQFKDDLVFAESAALVSQGRDPVQMLQALSMVPGGLRTLAAAGQAVYPGGTLDQITKELVILKASQSNNCQFCLNSHVDICRTTGISDDPINMLLDSEAQTPAQRAALHFVAAAMQDSNAIADEIFDELKDYFTEAQIAELALLLGYINMLNIFNNCLQVRYQGDYKPGSD